MGKSYGKDTFCLECVEERKTKRVMDGESESDDDDDDDEGDDL